MNMDQKEIIRMINGDSQRITRKCLHDKKSQDKLMTNGIKLTRRTVN